jgi:hypothetical protein
LWARRAYWKAAVGRSALPLGDGMRWVPLLLPTSLAIAAGPNLSDVDVAGITKATVDFTHSTPLAIGEGISPCKHTAENGCTLEVNVTVGDGDLTISKVNGSWIVGRWPREVAAHSQCVASLNAKWRTEDAQGLPVDRKARSDAYRACSPPSGQWGERIGQ